jgi:ribosome biogenesis SPOUT family RNA methylase Rps3
VSLKVPVLKIQQFIISVVPLDKIPYVDYPELRINKNESTEMPFRYVKGENGESIMPEVCQSHGPIILKMSVTDEDEGNG